MFFTSVRFFVDLFIFQSTQDDESSDESSEFVDVDLDGLRATRTFAISGSSKEQPEILNKRKSPLPSSFQEDLGVLFPSPITTQKKVSDAEKRKSLLVESLKDDTLQANEAQAIADLLSLGSGKNN